MSAQQLHHSEAQVRREAALRWLVQRDACEPLCVLAESQLALDALWREALAARAQAGLPNAVLGWSRQTLLQRALQLAEPSMLADGVQLASRAALQHTAELALQRAPWPADEPLGALRAAPGLPATALDALLSLRGSLCARDAAPLRLQLLHDAYEALLREKGWIDPPEVLRRALAAVASSAPVALLLYDLWPQSERESALLRALAERAPSALSVWPVGCWRAERAALGAPLDAPERSERLAAHLFSETHAGASALPRLQLLSAPGEAREALEIARQVLCCAERGVPFSQMAVLLRDPATQLPHLREALFRAQIPWHCPDGVHLPDPQGQALLELLHAAREDVPAVRLQAALSLRASLDDTCILHTTAAHDPCTLHDAHAALDPLQLQQLQPHTDAHAAPHAPATLPPASERAAQALLWQQLLLEAKAIGSRARCLRRLSALQKQLQHTGDEARAAACAQLLAWLSPLLDTLAALPARAPWREWLPVLHALSAQALWQPVAIQLKLQSLRPLAAADPAQALSLDEVLQRLTPLLSQRHEPGPQAHGALLLARAEQLLGQCFEALWVPGVAEGRFPQRAAEQPLWPDHLRTGASDLDDRQRRAEDERLRLRIAAGAARTQLTLSYSRLDLRSVRAQSPSLYLLEAWRAAHGDLPRADELVRAAQGTLDARLGWPAPRDPGVALDAVEHDLAALGQLLTSADAAPAGSAAPLLARSPQLTRVLRARAERWSTKRWYRNDCLNTHDALSTAALAPHQLTARSFSPTALQHYAACPYRFYLQAIVRLLPRKWPNSCEELDPLQRGSFVHEVLYRLLLRLQREQHLPLAPNDAPALLPLLDEEFDRAAALLREEVAPAVERVWQDQLAELRADVHEWLRRQCQEQHYVPAYFELAFGLSERGGERDPRSVDQPVTLASGLQVRGSIDLVERDRDGVLRATDHKTGQVRAQPGDVIKGGKTLQPVLYALVLERLLRENDCDANVWGGKLSYGTYQGGFTEVEFPLNDAARAAASCVTEAVDTGLRSGFLPTMPAKDECRFCDYRPICGPHEAARSARKPGAAPEQSLHTKPPAARAGREAMTLYTLGALRRQP